MEFTNPFNRVFYSDAERCQHRTCGFHATTLPGTGDSRCIVGWLWLLELLNGAGTSPRTGQLVARFTF